MLTPRRTDARRNRQAILRVADEAFAQGSEIVPLEEIARRAGLGRATVYRHFPDRKSLAAAVAEQQLGELRRTVGAADEERRPFRELLREVLAAQVSRRPLIQLFRELPAREQRRRADELIAVLLPAFRRAQVEEGLRGDLEPADLALVFEMIEAAVAAGTAVAGRDAATQRLIAVVIDGLFAAPSRR